MVICPACESENDSKEEYCLNCGQKLIENEEKEIISDNKLPIPKDKIILLDLNYTLISNSCRSDTINYPKRSTTENTNMNWLI